MIIINKLQTSLLGLTMQIPKHKFQEILKAKNIFPFVLAAKIITEGKLISHAKWK